MGLVLHVLHRARNIPAVEEEGGTNPPRAAQSHWKAFSALQSPQAQPRLPTFLQGWKEAQNFRLWSSTSKPTVNAAHKFLLA